MTQDSKTATAGIDVPSTSATPHVLTVPNLTESIDFFTSHLGFRLDMIVPADAPRTAVISGQGMTLRLVASQATLADGSGEVSKGVREFIISRLSTANAWQTGRAGMEYRDLIPGRMGGRVIASHIRISKGGATPDYVHYHKVRFQMIFCKAGWVRVVYEDQGAPFVIEAGDCVLQPPEIRHRVLESSAGLEVIEIGCPAVHETWADHELSLPTREGSQTRLFDGQRFVYHRASEAKWEPSPAGEFEVRDTGIAAATNGLAAAHVLRYKSPIVVRATRHQDELLFILQGELNVDCRFEGNLQLKVGDSIVIPAGVDYTLRADGGLEMLEVTLPAESSLG